MEVLTFGALDGQVTAYLHGDHDRLAAHKVRPALVICPGGAYRYCSPREQEAPALEFLAMGLQVFVLSYSCGERAGGYRPLRELAETVRILRARSGAWHIRPDQIAVMGFSAGGHLAASLGALWDDREVGLPAGCRPDALILCYPVLSTREHAHEESVRWVTGGDGAMREKLHLLDRVGPGFPPTFLWHGGEDASVPPENSLLMAARLRHSQIPVEYHLFETGAHGISTCTQEVETPDGTCRAWIPLCRTWLQHRFRYTP